MAHAAANRAHVHLRVGLHQCIGPELARLILARSLEIVAGQVGAIALTSARRGTFPADLRSGGPPRAP